MPRTVYLNGSYIPAEEAKVSVYDQGVLRGDGIFETMRAWSEKLPFFDGHFERFSNGAKEASIDLPLNKEGLLNAILETLKRNNLADARIRLVLTRGPGNSMDPMEAPKTPTLFILAEALPDYLTSAFYEKGVGIITIPLHLYNQFLPMSVKSTSYFYNMLAKRKARERGAFEAIFTDASGHCSEGTASNLFCARDRTLLTPPLASGALPGVTRKNLFSVAKSVGFAIEESPLHRDKLHTFDEVFLTSSVVGIIAVVTVNDHVIAKGMGERARNLRMAFADFIAGELQAG